MATPKVLSKEPGIELSKPQFVIENLPPHLRIGLTDAINSTLKPLSPLLPPSGRDLTVSFKPNSKRRMMKRKDIEPEPIVEGGTPLPFPYSSKDWLGKTPKSHVMEYFQRSNLQPPKWIRESHSTRQLHLIKVTFQDQTGKEVTLHADRYYRSVKEAEHNTSILVLSHLMPNAKSPKEIIEQMSQIQNFSKLQKRKKQESKPLRMAVYSNKQKMYSRTAPPPNLYGNISVKNNGHGNKQYEDYGYGYETQYYDPNSYNQGTTYPNTYNYYQTSYGYDFGGYSKTDHTQTNQPSITTEYPATVPVATVTTPVMALKLPTTRMVHAGYQEPSQAFLVQQAAPPPRTVSELPRPFPSPQQAKQLQSSTNFQQTSTHPPSYNYITNQSQPNQNWSYNTTNNAPPARSYNTPAASQGNYGTQGSSYGVQSFVAGQGVQGPPYSGQSGTFGATNAPAAASYGGLVQAGYQTPRSFVTFSLQ